MLRRRKKNKKEEYDSWIMHIRRARSARKPMETVWKRWYNIADDAMWGKGSKNINATQVNVIQSLLQNIIPNISFREGKTEIRAIAQQDIFSAAIYEKIIRYIVKKQHLAEEFMMVIFNALILGDGLLKIGYDMMPLLSEPQWNAGLATERGASPYSVYGMEWPLFEFQPDYTVDRWRRQRFFIHEMDKHIDEVQDNPLYKKAQLDKVKPSRRTDEIFYTGDPDNVDKKKDYVPIQEIHDLVNAEMLIVADKSGADDFLYRGPEPFGMIPMEHLFFFPRPMNVFGKGITQSIEKHIISISKMHTYMENILKKEALLKIIVDASKFGPKQRKELDKSEDSIISVPGDPKGSYEVINYGSASNQFAFERALGLKDQTVRNIAGAGRQQEGLHEVGVSSATESSILQGNADAINLWRSQRFADFAGRVLEKMLFIVTATYEPERIAKMVGYPVQAIAPFISEPYDPSKFMLTYGQAALMDSAERRENFMIFMKLFGGAINPAIAVQIAADIFDLQYTDEMLVPGQMLGNPAMQGQGGGQPATPGYRPAESQNQGMLPGGS